MLNAGYDWHLAGLYFNATSYNRRCELEKYGALPYILFMTNVNKKCSNGESYEQGFYFVNPTIPTVTAKDYKGRIAGVNLERKIGGGYVCFGNNQNKHFARNDAFIFEFSDNMESLKIAVFENCGALSKQLFELFKAGKIALIGKNERLDLTPPA